MNKQVDQTNIEDHWVGSFVPEGFTVIRFNCSKVTFTRKWDFEELGLEADVAARIGTLGRKKMIDPKIPARVRKVFDNTRAFLESVGTKIGDFYVFPVDKARDVTARMEGFQAELHKVKQYIIQSYDGLIEDFAREAEDLHPGMGKVIREQRFSLEYVERQIYFHWERPADMQLSAVNTIFEDLRSRVMDIENRWLDSGGGVIRLNAHTRATLIKLRDWCSSMSLCHAQMGTMVNNINAVIDQLPATFIRANSYPKEDALIAQLFNQLRHAKKIKQLERGIREEDIFADALGVTDQEEASQSNLEATFGLEVATEVSAPSEFMGVDMTESSVDSGFVGNPDSHQARVAVPEYSMFGGVQETSVAVEPVAVKQKPAPEKARDTEFGFQKFF
ncbi:hypothetical protein A6E01_19120 (plasmid) [Vibrio breoganii]|uniref:DUF3150 domain-containing protein n=2 Tax=Vibrio TaxID=662 RepID=A0AAN0XZC2_9VIBR|nr:DUF3150 domain-containing protein [Vibrio breoganii]ANO35326.1 hypothetical protein A6E01_19120 [Vibrio breoganii]PML12752.1 hypothetical protein BCT84_02385 [Vibrio breoganii]